MRLISRVVVVFVLLAASPAFAAQHFMVIQEVFVGPPSDGTSTPLTPDQRAQYVMLRMTSSAQNAVNNTFLRVEDADGNLLGRFGTLVGNVPNGGAPCAYPNCPAIVIGTQAADDLFTFAFDKVVNGQASRVALPRAGGRVCFVLGSSSVIDCVAWGNFDCRPSGNCKACSNNPNQLCTVNGQCGMFNTCIPTRNVFRVGDFNANGCDVNFGTPATTGGPEYGQALARPSSSFNCPAKENSTEFALAFPLPVTNAGTNDNTDTDGDGLIDVLDCDDTEVTGTAFLWPVADLQNLRLQHDQGTSITDLSYSQEVTSGTDTTYDVAGGTVANLSGFADAAALSCDEPTGASQDFIDPPDGVANYYLVRASSSAAACGGGGTYGPGTSPAFDGLCP